MYARKPLMNAWEKVQTNLADNLFSLSSQYRFCSCCTLPRHILSEYRHPLDRLAELACQTTCGCLILTLTVWQLPLAPVVRYLRYLSQRVLCWERISSRCVCVGEWATWLNVDKRHSRTELKQKVMISNNALLVTTTFDSVSYMEINYSLCDSIM